MTRLIPFWTHCHSRHSTPARAGSVPPGRVTPAAAQIPSFGKAPCGTEPTPQKRSILQPALSDIMAAGIVRGLLFPRVARVLAGRSGSCGSVWEKYTCVASFFPTLGFRVAGCLHNAGPEPFRHVTVADLPFPRP